MYDVQREINADGVRFRMIEGSVFEAEDNGASGIAIYVPCGLTAFRANLPNYMIPYGLPIGEEKIYTTTMQQGFKSMRKDSVLGGISAQIAGSAKCFSR